ncbi:MAG TPA: hypothetical protein VJN21_12270 [Candidatus Acidoferrales bacterium]|nr:hypothetical protein [Candidatus Acidoferrales bacterium]
MNPGQAERFQWIVLTIVGLVAGLALALPIGVPIFAVLGAMAGTPIVLSIVGFSVGTAQWPIIRRHMPGSGWWIAVSALGMAVGLTAGVILVEQIGRAAVGGPINFRMIGVVGRAASFGTIGLIAGASLGFTQWLLLRRHARHSSNWIRTNSWSLGLGLASGSLLADALVARTGSIAGIAILFVVGSACAGICTARTLAKVFSGTPREASATDQ